MVRRHGWWIVALAVLVAPAAASQEPDGQVAPPGRLRVGVGGQYLHLGGQFTPGGREPLGAEWGGLLGPAAFEELEPFAELLSAFLAATEPGPEPVEPADLQLGTLGVDVAWNTRTVPYRIALGVLPRVEVGVGASVYRHERFTRRFDLAGGRLGVNPDLIGNAALLSQVDTLHGAPLGRGALLPVAGTRLGNELQARVLATTGEALELPEAPLDFFELADVFDVEPFPYVLGDWLAGDVEIDARVAVLRSFDAPFYPEEASPLDYRLTVIAAARLPTGARMILDPALDWGPPVGLAAQRIGAVGDLFVGERLWVTGRGSLARVGRYDVRVPIVTPGGFFPPEPGSHVARRNPGRETELWLQPRFRLTREIGIGGSYRREGWGTGTEEIVGGAVSLIPARSRTSLGGSLRYSTLPGFAEGRSRFQIEATTGLSVAVSGSAGVPASRLAYAQLTIYRRLWGSPAGEP